MLPLKVSVLCIKPIHQTCRGWTYCMQMVVFLQWSTICYLWECRSIGDSAAGYVLSERALRSFLFLLSFLSLWALLYPIWFENLCSSSQGIKPGPILHRISSGHIAIGLVKTFLLLVQNRLPKWILKMSKAQIYVVIFLYRIWPLMGF